jgi:hypothetical protein
MKVIQVCMNCFEIQNESYTLLQSYRVIVAKKMNGQLYLDSKYHDYSKTTSRHVNAWLRIDNATKKRMIQSGNIILSNLNK